MASGAAHADIVVLGAGSWGTALAMQCARAGRPARLWGRDRALLEDMARARVNHRYLPGAPFPAGLHPVPELRSALTPVAEFLSVTLLPGTTAPLAAIGHARLVRPEQSRRFADGDDHCVAGD